MRKTLPGILDKLGLKYKKVSILQKNNDLDIASTAWKITEGLDNFKESPLISFATGLNLKKDVETLPKIEAAIKKFGVPSDKLTITNDWLQAYGMNCHRSLF